MGGGKQATEGAHLRKTLSPKTKRETERQREERKEEKGKAENDLCTFQNLKQKSKED